MIANPAGPAKPLQPPRFWAVDGDHHRLRDCRNRVRVFVKVSDTPDDLGRIAMKDIATGKPCWFYRDSLQLAEL